MFTEAKRHEFMILTFINAFRLKFPGTEYFFTNGGCKIFADILKGNFPDGKIFHISGHYIFSFQERFYDVMGEYLVEDETLLDELGFCKTIEKRMNTYENIFDICMYDMLQKREDLFLKKNLTEEE